ncbi:MAG: transposase [Propionibacteriaceae bacterium]|jgi:REP element-mobilizing transposase RayT|nr:transposase [Propionibacteriaceae bacterium]
MARPPRQLGASGIYHVTCRGLDRHPLFYDDADRRRFLELVARAKAATHVALLAFCLMDDHVHLLLQQRGQPISDFMRRAAGEYAQWFNAKYDRVGPLFDGRFRSQLVPTDAYFAAVVAYIHRNPVEAGLVTSTAAYPWSSRSLLGQAPGLVDTDVLAGYAPLAAITEREDHPVAPPVPEPGGVRGPQDAEAEAWLRDLTGTGTPASFHALPTADQKTAVAALAARGATQRQIARITGVPRGIVTRWLRPT